MITVVFSAPRGGSDGGDGWLAVWPPSSCLSPGQCLEMQAGAEGSMGRLLGGWGRTRLALVRQMLSALSGSFFSELYLIEQLLFAELACLN